MRSLLVLRRPAVLEFARRAQVRYMQEHATSSRAALTAQGISFALNKLRRRHPTQAQGDLQVGPRSFPVIMNGRYYNPWNTDAASKKIREILALLFDRQFWPRMTDNELKALQKVMVVDTKPYLEQIRAHDALMRIKPYEGIRVTWLSHSSTLVQMGGFTFLTDPVFSERCSPVQFAGPRRTHPPPHRLEDLPPVDFVLISHNHYDHLDYNTIKAIGPRPTYYVPLGLKEWFTSQGFTNCVELGWWDEGTVTKRHEGGVNHLRIACTPAQHWSSRTLWDRMKTLWCSWAVMTEDDEEKQIPRQRFYFGGDSGYCPGFKEIGAQYGPFDVAAIPIGAFEPRWFMKEQHVDPQSAVDIHADVQAKWSFGIHWGTFPLAGDAWHVSVRELYETCNQRGIPMEQFFVMRPGETWLAGQPREPFLHELAPRRAEDVQASGAAQ